MNVTAARGLAGARQTGHIFDGECNNVPSIWPNRITGQRD
jgi:hypothetical protein